MKITFDSEDQKNAIIKVLANAQLCPSNIGLIDEDDFNVCFDGSHCTKCWQKSVEIKVKEKKND